ncbi:hypothetical protein [Actinomadura atramentaria]|uniref:hypothetical protein n=1 Tax=Actinomadura atramentaria TaxID=1990 RepID=UPI000367355C|nr:hypothetical protein [Actinomadura atramentaria]
MTRLATFRHAALAVAAVLCAAFVLVLAAPAHHSGAARLGAPAASAVAPGPAGPASGRCCVDDERPHEAPRHAGVRVPALLPDLKLPRGHSCLAVRPGAPRALAAALVRRGHDGHLHALSRTVSGDVAALLQVFRC